MNRCATCKHWKNPWEDAYDLERLTTPTFNEDDPIVQPDDAPRWGTCTLIRLARYREPVEITAFTKDGSDYVADLHTREDFGCTLWEPSP